MSLLYKSVLLMAFTVCSSMGLAQNESLNGGIKSSKSLVTHTDGQKQIELLKSMIYRQKSIKSGSGIVWTVGAGSGCQFSTIQSAVNAADLNNGYEIRVATNKNYHENLRIAHPDLILKGGYDDCIAAQNDSGNGEQVALLGGDHTEPVVVFKNNSEGEGVRYYYQMLNFDVSQGTGNQVEFSGGINVMDNQIDITLDNLLVHENTGTKGGGIYMEGDNSELIVKDSIFFLNEATNGGGLFCHGATVLVSGSSGFSLNEANGTIFDGNGGGVYLTSSCSFNLFSGTSGGLFDFRGIAGNKANRNGGGLFADGGANAYFWGNLIIGDHGNHDQPINITANEANLASSVGKGGGLYATGAGTAINGYATIINNNDVKAGTSSDGGGIYLGSMASMTMSRLNFPCWDEYQCNQIKANTVNGSNSSSAGIFSLNANQLSIKNTWIAEHNATENTFMFAQATDVLFEGNIFTANGDGTPSTNAELIRLWNSSSGGATFAFNTFVANQVDHLFSVSQNQAFNVYSSIIKESPGTLVLDVDAGSNPQLTFTCLITHEQSTFNGGLVVIDDPLFVDEANGDFHLTSQSPAIDYCGQGVYSPTSRDTDNEVRGWDDLGMIDNNGSYDLGADEYYPDTIADVKLDLTLLTAGPHHVNQTVVYEITVTNDGPDVATGVVVNQSMQNLAVTAIQGAGCSSLPCDLDNMGSGNFDVIQVAAKINALGAFSANAQVSSLDYDVNTNNNSDQISGTADEEFADVQLTDNYSPSGAYHSGQIINYQMTLINNGPDTARNAQLSFSGFNATLLSIQSAKCSDINCEIAALANQETEVFEVSVQIITGGSFDWTFNGFSDSTDSINNNQTIVYQGMAQNTGDLTVATQLLTPGPYVAGQTVSFEVIFENLGPNDIGGIAISMDSENVTIADVIGDCEILPCSPSPINSGSSGVFRVDAEIEEAGLFSAEFTISSNNSHDPDMNNNTSSAGGNAGVNPDIIFANGFEIQN